MEHEFVSWIYIYKADAFCPKRLTVMMVAAMQGIDQHIRSNLGFSILPKDTSTCRPGNQTNDLPITRRWYYPRATATDNFMSIAKHCQPGGRATDTIRGSPVSGGFILWRPWTSVLKFHVNPYNSCWDIHSSGAAPAETEPCEHLLPPLTTCNREQHEPSWQWWTALYAIPSEAHEAVSIHKRRTPPVIGFPAQMFAQSVA